MSPSGHIILTLILIVCPPLSIICNTASFTASNNSITDSTPALPQTCRNAGIDPTEKPCRFLNDCKDIGEEDNLLCIRGKCSCPGDMVWSRTRCVCKIPAGGFQCTRSGDCADGARCWHPTRKRCNYHGCQTRSSGPTQCHCCRGPIEGENGKCPDETVSSHCGNPSSSANRLEFTAARNIAKVVLLLAFGKYSYY